MKNLSAELWLRPKLKLGAPWAMVMPLAFCVNMDEMTWAVIDAQECR